jgi:hypothetical protein
MSHWAFIGLMSVSTVLTIGLTVAAYRLPTNGAATRYNVIVAAWMFFYVSGAGLLLVSETLYPEWWGPNSVLSLFVIVWLIDSLAFGLWALLFC